MTMNRRAQFHLAMEIVAAAALCLASRAAATAQSYNIRPNSNCNSTGTCYIRPGTYGYNDTWWRQWPQYRPAVSDPRAIGAQLIPTPPGISEKQLHPQAPAGNEGSILPNLAPSGGGPAAPVRPPRTEAPGTQIAPGPEGTLSIPGINPNPIMPNLSPGDLGPGTTTPNPTAPLLPTPAQSGTGSLAPKQSEKEPLKSPDLEKPGAKPLESMPLKTEPSLSPGDFLPPKPSGANGANLRRRGAVSADNEDDPGHDRKLVEASFEQRDGGAKKTLRSGLNGYCPVELHEKEKWVTGRSEFRLTYQGQVFHFSSEAASRRFAAAPEKYAPANGGIDAVLALEENRVVSGSIQHSAVWQGRLYLFASSANLAAFREDPSRYAIRAQWTAESNDIPDRPASSDATQLMRAKKTEEPQQLRLPGDSL
jgi:YHS domain-containing protein